MSGRVRLALVAAAVVVAALTGGWIVPALAGGVHGRASGSASPVASSSSAAAPTAKADGPLPSGPTLHYLANDSGSLSVFLRLGYNLIDTPARRSAVDALPAGMRALVWIGELDNTRCTPDYSWSQFTAAVDALTGDPKVYGYFLSDEPHPSICPSAVADIRQRADYIRANDPTHKSFIVVLNGRNMCPVVADCEYAAFAPAKTHVDLIGIDPYPCNISDPGACDLGKIDNAIQLAEQGGIPASALVPVFQVFGQQCGHYNFYRLPSAVEMTLMLQRYASYLPHPAFDFTYGWSHQYAACPTLIDADGTHGYPDLQSVLRDHNRS